jgi:hypothetical protein
MMRRDKKVVGDNGVFVRRFNEEVVYEEQQGKYSS